MHSSTRAIAMLLITTACTQQPVPVDMRGQLTFGRNSGNGYASNNATGSPAAPSANYQPYQPAPVYTTAASTPSVSVSDLAVLSPASGSAQPKAKPAETASTPAPINPWTKRPHGNGEAVVPQSNAGHINEKPVAQLDRVINNDNVAKPIAKAESNGFMWPVAVHKIISGFGPKGGGKTNDGINIASPEGEPVWAAADGEVVYVGNELQGYGNMVLIKHPGNKTTAYAHMGRATVDKYDRVKQGDIIGYVGATGNVKEPQLHFAIRDGKDPVDPAKYLNRSVASN